jgi:hypothetical protein
MASRSPETTNQISKNGDASTNSLAGPVNATAYSMTNHLPPVLPESPPLVLSPSDSFKASNNSYFDSLGFDFSTSPATSPNLERSPHIESNVSRKNSSIFKGTFTRKKSNTSTASLSAPSPSFPSSTTTDGRLYPLSIPNASTTSLTRTRQPSTPVSPKGPKQDQILGASTSRGGTPWDWSQNNTPNSVRPRATPLSPKSSYGGAADVIAPWTFDAVRLIPYFVREALSI